MSHRISIIFFLANNFIYIKKIDHKMTKDDKLNVWMTQAKGSVLKITTDKLAAYKNALKWNLTQRRRGAE